MSPQNYNDRLADYVDVKERIRLFYEVHPDGRLTTTRIKVTSKPDGVPRVWASAAAFRTPDDPIPGVGTSWMILPGSTPYTRGSEIENTETSAWGRAIGALGIGIDKSIASRDEVNAKSGEGERQEARTPERTDDGGLIGDLIAQGRQDFALRQGPDGAVIPFRIKVGRQSQIAVAEGAIAVALDADRDAVLGKRVTVWGHFTPESFDKGNETISYTILHVERIATPDWTMPAPDGEAPTEALPWDPQESARLDAEAVA
jgi:hypothetical protein